MAILMSCILLLESRSVLARAETWGGWMSPGTCFFLTGKEYGVGVEVLDAGSIHAGYSSAQYCGLTATEVAASFSSILENLEDKGWMEDCLPNLFGEGADCRQGWFGWLVPLVPRQHVAGSGGVGGLGVGGLGVWGSGFVQALVKEVCLPGAIQKPSPARKTTSSTLGTCSSLL